MNKIFLVLLIGFSLIGSSALAAGPITGCTTTHDIQMPGYTATASTDLDPAARYEDGGEGRLGQDWGAICLLDTVYTVTDWIFYGLLSLVTVFTVYGGFLIVTAGEEAEKVDKGRDFVLYATVGLIVAFLSRVIPSIAESVVAG